MAISDTSVAPNAAVPAVVRITRSFLVLCMVAWALGSVQAAIRPGGDVLALASRLLLLGASVFAFGAIGRRSAYGRWVAVGLGCFVLYRGSVALAYSWRATHGDLSAPAGLIAYSSPAEAWIAFLLTAGLFALLAFAVLGLAFGAKAAAYFNP